MKKNIKRIIGIASSAALLGGVGVLATGNSNNNVEVLGTSNTRTSQEGNITLEEAKEIAFNHAGVNGEDARFDDQELDDDGIYELEFTVDSVEYEFDISASNGAILEAERDAEKDDHNKENTSTGVSLEEAKEIAFNHAGVNGENAHFDDEELDDDNVWELEFIVDGVEFEYEIAAHSGDILEAERDGIDGQDDDYDDVDDRDDDYDDVDDQDDDADDQQASVQPTPAPEQTNISSEQALNIAVEDAGTSGETEVEFDDGYWEVEIETGSQEFEYAISTTGEILGREVENDD